MNKPAMNFLALSRPLFYVILLLWYITTAKSLAMTALYSVSAAFFVASSAVVVHWISVPQVWVVRVVVAEVLFTGALSIITGLVHPNGPMAAIYSPIFVSIYLALDRPWWRPMTALAGLLFILSFLPPLPYHGIARTLFQAAIYAAFLIFSGAMGLLIRAVEEQRDRSQSLLSQVEESRVALERAHRQLQESAHRQQEMAVLQERQRLAREIHDSVAHLLTALVVQVQAARKLQGRSPEQAQESLLRSEEMARQALLETRQAVRALHPAGLHLQTELAALQRLGRDFGAATGISITVTADEQAAALPPDSHRLEQLYRIFQEALTNAHRHGEARRVDAHLALDGQGLTLTIQNEGRPPATLEPGVGLRSMTERAGALGGEVQFEPTPTGMHVRVTVPIREEVAG